MVLFLSRQLIFLRVYDIENKMKKTRINNYLKEFTKIADKWFQDRKAWVTGFHEFFVEFFKENNLANAQWQDFQKLGNHIHSFNALPLAKSRALGENMNHPLEHYREVFRYLRYGDDDDRTRFNNLVDKKSGRALACFGESAVSELIGQAFPEKYVFYNSRDVKAVEFLGLKIEKKRGDKFGDIFIRYNQLIRSEIYEEYKKIVKISLNVPIGLQIDQFFSWLYEEKVFKNEIGEKKAPRPKGKIYKIAVKSFNQFKDFTIDLTYPANHENKEKRGKPLDKVCFIGQSGTGKTTLLNLIRHLTDLDKKNIPAPISKSVEIYYRLADKDDNRRIDYKVALENGEINCEVIDIKNQTNTKKHSELETRIAASASPALIYFPPDIITQIGALNKDLDEEIEIKGDDFSMDEAVIDFSEKDVERIWNEILQKTKEYRKAENNKKIKLANILINTNDEKEISNGKKEFEAWQAENPNPIKDLAENCLNKFLSRFNLKINTELKATEDLKFIRFEPLQRDEEIQPEFLSTGSQQIILKAIPLYEIAPRNSIILFDEPENSLYPDVQREIVGFFQEMTDNSQFFFATHSPVIASSFEPWEVIELVFDKYGNIRQKEYYKGERDVENYFIDPRYLRWDNILMKSFGVQVEGNDFYRERELTKALRLKKQLEAEKT